MRLGTHPPNDSDQRWISGSGEPEVPFSGGQEAPLPEGRRHDRVGEMQWSG